MSEHILENLMQLFAIIAKINGQDNGERAVVEQFLTNRLSLEESDRYLALYDEYSIGVKSRESVATNSKMLLICTAINEELTQQQKYAVLLYLFILTSLDDDVDKREREFMGSVADVFNIQRETYGKVERFCIADKYSHLDEKDYLIVSDRKDLEFEHALFLHRPGLKGDMTFMSVPELGIFLVKYHGNGEYYLNGKIIEPYRPATFRLGSVIRGAAMSPIYYSEISTEFLKKEDVPEIVFEATDISFTLKDKRTILHKVNIVERSQNLVAIMGPSGAGKSTLMELLNGIRTPSTGSVTINGIDLNKERAYTKGLIGYVPQDDLLIEELTVFENLFYAAKLCYRDKTNEELKTIVDQTLADLGLTEIADFTVGSPLNKVISGGERKRVNIGLELLRQPPIMFVDEPTSGLSSRDSLNIMTILKELAMKGKIIFTVIHQPSSDIFKLFDKLIILDTGGYPIYYGHPLETLTYFRGQLNQINKEKAVCSECGNVNNEQIFDIIEAKTVNEYGRTTKERRIHPKTWNKLFKKHFKQPKHVIGLERIESSQKIAGRFKQFYVFLVRDLKSKFANRQYMLINTLQAPLLALVLSLINRYSPESEYLFSKNENIPVFLFISVITAMFMGLVVSAEEIFKDRKILKRERFLDLSKGSYLMSKLIILFGFSAFQTLVYTILAVWILGMQGMFIPFWLVLFSTSCFANLLGLNISASFDSAVTIYILIPILLIPQLVLGGVVINFDKINSSFRFTERAVPLLGDIMASRWAYEALMVSQFMYNEYEKILYPTEQKIANYEFKKLYLMPILKSKLQYLSKNALNKDLNIKREVIQEMVVFRNSLQQEIEEERLQLDWELPTDPKRLLDTSLVARMEDLIVELESRYGSKIGFFQNQKLEVLEKTAKAAGDYAILRQLEERSYNEQVGDIVKNIENENRIIETSTEFVPKIYSIFMLPRPLNSLDYRAPMFAPAKHFLGVMYPTPYFNVIVIWGMVILLYVTLYFDVLRRAVVGLGK